MKLIDRNGRLFGKVSIIDVVVVLVVVAMVAAFQFKNTELEASKTTGSDTPITFTVLCESVNHNVANALVEGDLVYDKDRSSGGAIGKVVSIERMEGSRMVQYDDGTFYRTPNPYGQNLLVTIEGKGTVTEGRYAINKIYELGVNASRNFYTQYTNFTGSVLEIG